MVGNEAKCLALCIGAVVWFITPTYTHLVYTGCMYMGSHLRSHLRGPPKSFDSESIMINLEFQAGEFFYIFYIFYDHNGERTGWDV